MELSPGSQYESPFSPPTPWGYTTKKFSESATLFKPPVSFMKLDAHPSKP